MLEFEPVHVLVRVCVAVLVQGQRGKEKEVCTTYYVLFREGARLKKTFFLSFEMRDTLSE